MHINVPCLIFQAKISQSLLLVYINPFNSFLRHNSTEVLLNSSTGAGFFPLEKFYCSPDVRMTHSNKSRESIIPRFTYIICSWVIIDCNFVHIPKGRGKFWGNSSEIYSQISIFHVPVPDSSIYIIHVKIGQQFLTAIWCNSSHIFKSVMYIIKRQECNSIQLTTKSLKLSSSLYLLTSSRSRIFLHVDWQR